MAMILFLVTSCEAAPEPFASEGIKTHTEATKWVKANYKAETVTPDSTMIHKLLYFPKGRFMMIYFNSKRSKGYLYHNVSSELWRDFNNSTSKGRFYNSRIKGNKNIYLKLKK